MFALKKISVCGGQTVIGREPFLMGRSESIPFLPGIKDIMVLKIIFN